MMRMADFVDGPAAKSAADLCEPMRDLIENVNDALDLYQAITERPADVDAGHALFFWVTRDFSFKIAILGLCSLYDESSKNHNKHTVNEVLTHLETHLSSENIHRVKSEDLIKLRVPEERAYAIVGEKLRVSMEQALEILGGTAICENCKRELIIREEEFISTEIETVKLLCKKCKKELTITEIKKATSKKIWQRIEKHLVPKNSRQVRIEDLTRLGVSEEQACAIILGLGEDSKKELIITEIEKAKPKREDGHPLHKLFLFRNKVLAHRQRLDTEEREEIGKGLPSPEEMRNLNEWVRNLCRLLMNVFALRDLDQFNRPGSIKVATENVINKLVEKTPQDLHVEQA